MTVSLPWSRGTARLWANKDSLILPRHKHVSDSRRAISPCTLCCCFRDRVRPSAHISGGDISCVTGPAPSLLCAVVPELSHITIREAFAVLPLEASGPNGLAQSWVAVSLPPAPASFCKQEVQDIAAQRASHRRAALLWPGSALQMQTRLSSQTWWISICLTRSPSSSFYTWKLKQHCPRIPSPETLEKNQNQFPLPWMPFPAPISRHHLCVSKSCPVYLWAVSDASCMVICTVSAPGISHLLTCAFFPMG